MSKKVRVLYFYATWSPFIAKDVEILETKYEVLIFQFNPKHKLYTIVTFLSQVIFLTKNIFKSKLYVYQFGGFHSFLPAFYSKVFSISSILIAGGTDCVSFPLLAYGNLRPGMLGTFTKLSHKLSTWIVPVDESLIYNEYSYKNPHATFTEQGIKAFIPKLQSHTQVIYNGYADIAKNHPYSKKKNSFITIASGISSISRYQLKGIDLFIEMAKKMPSSQFTIIGADTLPEEFPANVQLIPFMDNVALVKHLLETEYYVQLSISEGFPNALCEAMVCSCIPVVTNVGAMPYIVQKNGIVVSEKNVTVILEQLNAVTAYQIPKLAQSARESILTRFPLERRKKELLLLCDQISKGKQEVN